MSRKQHIELPEWEIAKSRYNSGITTPIERFVYFYEPHGEEECREWRERIQLALAQAYETGKMIGKDL